MKLKGERILIRDYTFNDIDDFYEYASDPSVGPNAGWKPVPSIEIARRVLSGHIISKETFGIVLLENKKLIGSISIYNGGLRKYKRVKQLGFSLNSKYWGNGYMSEAIKLAIDYVFNYTDCDVLEVGHHSDNYRSKRVIEKAGFNYDGRLCKYKVLYDGRLVDADFYSMTKDEYERKRLL